MLPNHSPGLNTGGFSATVSGGGPNTAILDPGDNLNYSGAAGHIFAYSGVGSIDDTAGAATMAALDGIWNVVATGADTLLLGGYLNLALPGTARVTALSGGHSVANLEGNVIYTAGASDTITATAGTSTVFGATGDTYNGANGTVYFVGSGSASTVIGGAGDTVYGDGTTFIGGTGNKIFAGSSAATVGTAASTVYAGAGGGATIQTGAHGDLVYRQASADRVVGGGKDTIWGSAASGVAPTIFGLTGSYGLMLSGMKGGFAIGLGNNTTLDGASASGGMSYFAEPGFGNQTFIGSASGADSFYIGSQAVGTSLISIQDWHAGDTLNLTAFGAADQATASGAFTGGSGLLKLSDGTTVVFAGSQPTPGTGGFYT